MKISIQFEESLINPHNILVHCDLLPSFEISRRVEHRGKLTLVRHWLRRLARLIYNWTLNPNRRIRRISQMLWVREGMDLQDSNAQRIAQMMSDNEKLTQCVRDSTYESEEDWTLFMAHVAALDTVYEFVSNHVFSERVIVDQVSEHEAVLNNDIVLNVRQLFDSSER